LGITFDTLRVADAARLVVERSRRGLPFAYVVTPNVDHRVRLSREPGLHPLYSSAWMTLCDSRVIELMARFDGAGVRASPGADLVEHLFEREIGSGDPINIIGSTPDVIETLRARFGLQNVRWHECPQDLRSAPEAIEAAARFVADNPAPLTFICVGSPQQELVARAIIDRGDAQGVGLCCGASLEFLTGKVPRAPKWMRNLALEWLHRLATNPIRFSRRYLVDGPTIFPIWLKTRRRNEINENDELGSTAPTRGGRVMPVHPAA
jgi:exopolysaccharide biosynthesis WecB/TagA/CpsF family protein